MNERKIMFETPITVVGSSVLFRVSRCSCPVVAALRASQRAFCPHPCEPVLQLHQQAAAGRAFRNPPGGHQAMDRARVRMTRLGSGSGELFDLEGEMADLELKYAHLSNR